MYIYKETREGMDYLQVTIEEDEVEERRGRLQQSSSLRKMASCVISRIISRSALSAPHRPLLVAAFLGNNRLSPSAPSAPLVRNFSTGTASSSSTPQQHWRYTGVKPSESDLEVGLDFHHWRVLVEKPVGDPTRDQIIDSYIDILATVVGSKEDARLKIYSVSTKFNFEFGVLVPEDVAAKLIGVPYVLRVIPDMYYTHSDSSYGGEDFTIGSTHVRSPNH